MYKKAKKPVFIQSFHIVRILKKAAYGCKIPSLHMRKKKKTEDRKGWHNCRNYGEYGSSFTVPCKVSSCILYGWQKTPQQH